MARKKPQVRGSKNPVQKPSTKTEENTVTNETESSKDTEDTKASSSSAPSSNDSGPTETADQTSGKATKAAEKSDEDKAVSGKGSSSTPEKKSSPTKKQTTKSSAVTPAVEEDTFFIELVTFKKAMEGKRPSGQVYAQLQKGVNRTFMNVLSIPAKQSAERLTTLLDYMHENSGVLSRTNLCLFPSQWENGAQAYNRYTGLVHLFTKTANSKTRKKALKDISMERLFDRSYPAVVKDNLVAFYL